MRRISVSSQELFTAASRTFGNPAASGGSAAVAAAVNGNERQTKNISLRVEEK